MKLKPMVNEAVDCLRTEVAGRLDDRRALRALEEGMETFVVKVCLGQAQRHGRFSSNLTASISQRLKKEVRSVYTEEQWENDNIDEDIIETLRQLWTFDEIVESAEEWVREEQELRETEDSLPY